MSNMSSQPTYLLGTYLMSKVSQNSLGVSKDSTESVQGLDDDLSSVHKCGGLRWLEPSSARLSTVRVGTLIPSPCPSSVGRLWG